MTYALASLLAASLTVAHPIWEQLDYLYCRKTRDCVIRGDPHVLTFDDGHYSYMGKGEFLMAESPNAKFQVNACFASFNTHSVSYTTKTAFKCGNDAIVLAEAKTQTVDLYEKQGVSWVKNNAAWNAHGIEASTDPKRPFWHYIRCPAPGSSSIYDSTLMEIIFRTVTERKTGVPLKVLNAHVHIPVKKTYGDVEGACNTYPAVEPGKFKGRGGDLVAFPADPKDQTFGQNPLTVESWRVNGLPDSLFSLLGVQCPATDGMGNALMEEDLRRLKTRSSPSCQNQCGHNATAVAQCEACVQVCKDTFELDKPTVDDCTFDVVMECDGNCKDVATFFD